MKYERFSKILQSDLDYWRKYKKPEFLELFDGGDYEADSVARNVSLMLMHSAQAEAARRTSKLDFWNEEMFPWEALGDYLEYEFRRRAREATCWCSDPVMDAWRRHELYAWQRLFGIWEDLNKEIE